MNSFDSIIVFLHIICAAIFVVTLIIMQLVVNPAMSKIPAGEDKMRAQSIIQNRWHPVVDAAIIIQTLTGIFLIITRWELIGVSLILHVKVTFGIITLLFANLLHFYWRGIKRRLKAEGKTEQFATLSKRTMFIEKVVLIGATITFILGATFNHL